MTEQRLETLVLGSRNYKGKSKDDLNFKKGQLITVTGRSDEKEQYQGEYTGKKGLKTGWFPYSAVRVLTDKEVNEIKLSKKFMKDEEKKKKEEEKKRLSEDREKDKREKLKQTSQERLVTKKKADTNTGTVRIKYLAETKTLNAKIANRPSKETLIERGILKAHDKDREGTIRAGVKLPFMASKSKDQLEKKLFFGVPLGQLMYTSYTDFQVPQVILKLIKHVEEKGGTAEMNDLRDLIEAGETMDLNNYSVHSVAGILKLFFRQLPEPLFTFRLFDDFTKALGIHRVYNQLSDSPDKEKKLEKVRLALKELPPTNCCLLRSLLELLVIVSHSSDINKMNSTNLGIVFGPTLLWQKDSDPLNDMLCNLNTSDVVALLIDHFDTFFPESPSRKSIDPPLITRVPSIQRLPETSDEPPLPSGWERAVDAKIMFANLRLGGIQEKENNPDQVIPQNTM